MYEASLPQVVVRLAVVAYPPDPGAPDGFARSVCCLMD